MTGLYPPQAPYRGHAQRQQDLDYFSSKSTCSSAEKQSNRALADAKSVHTQRSRLWADSTDGQTYRESQANSNRLIRRCDGDTDYQSQASTQRFNNRCAGDTDYESQAYSQGLNRQYAADGNREGQANSQRFTRRYDSDPDYDSQASTQRFNNRCAGDTDYESQAHSQRLNRQCAGDADRESQAHSQRLNRQCTGDADRESQANLHRLNRRCGADSDYESQASTQRFNNRCAGDTDYENQAHSQRLNRQCAGDADRESQAHSLRLNRRSGGGLDHQSQTRSVNSRLLGRRCAGDADCVLQQPSCPARNRINIALEESRLSSHHSCRYNTVDSTDKKRFSTRRSNWSESLASSDNDDLKSGSTVITKPTPRELRDLVKSQCALSEKIGETVRKFEASSKNSQHRSTKQHISPRTPETCIRKDNPQRDTAPPKGEAPKNMLTTCCARLEELCAKTELTLEEIIAIKISTPLLRKFQKIHYNARRSELELLVELDAMPEKIREVVMTQLRLDKR